MSLRLQALTISLAGKDDEGRKEADCGGARTEPGDGGNKIVDCGGARTEPGGGKDKDADCNGAKTEQGKGKHKRRSRELQALQKDLAELLASGAPALDRAKLQESFGRSSGSPG
jgi:hypothetical protein